jgi:hypothetical protein
MKIYISGQITGLPFDKVRAKFEAVEKKSRKMSTTEKTITQI